MFDNIIWFRKKPQADSHEIKTLNNDHEEKTTSLKSEKNDLPEDLFLDASSILKEPKLAILLRKIRVMAGVSDEYFDTYYLPVINNCATYCQSVPASKDNHHSYSFGLITHLLETTLYSMRSRLQFVYKVTDKEEDIDNYKNAYNYAVFVAAMNHDIGKTISDNRYFIRHNKSEKYSIWNLLSSPPPTENDNIQYKIERKINKKGKLIYKYNSHSIMNTALLCRTVPAVGWAWISSLHPKLETDIYHAVGGDYDNADVIGKAVTHGDSLSANMSMKGKVTDIETASKQTPLFQTLKNIIADPTQHSLSVNNPSYTTLVKKDGLIYISGTALEKSIRKEAPNHSLSVPQSSNKLEAMVTDFYTIPAASGDTMWWLTFNANGKKTETKKKDIKCFVFDSSIYDPDDLLPNAENIEIHKSIKSMSDSERDIEAKKIVQEVTEEQKKIDDDVDIKTNNNGAPKKETQKHNNSNLSVGGKQIKTPLANLAGNGESPVNDKQSDTQEKTQTIRKNESKNKKKEEKAANKINKFKPTSLKGSDLLNLINKGSEGVVSEEPPTNQPKSSPKRSSKRATQPKGNPKPAIQPKNDSKPIAQPKNDSKPIVQPKNNSKPAIQPKSDSKPIIKVEEKISPKDPNVGIGVSKLLPSLADLSKADTKNDNEEISTSNNIKHQKEPLSMEPLSVPPTASEINIETTEEPSTFEIDPPAYIKEDTLPCSYDWQTITEEEFEASVNGPLVSFVDNDIENSTKTSDFGLSNSEPNIITTNYAKPSWSTPISPKVSDYAFMQELFGVLQQSINNGLSFNRIGSFLYIVPNGIFLASPFVFKDPDFPLSTRGDYYKNLIRNSSFLARADIEKGKTVVTGRILRIRKMKNNKIKIKTTGALTGFYLVTGKRFQLTLNDNVIKPTRHLVFDHHSINGVIQLDNDLPGI